MLTDDTRCVGYEYEYISVGGYPVTILLMYGYEGGLGMSAEELLAEAAQRHDNCKIMTLAEFNALDRELTISSDVHEVDEETFNDMLNVLPPLKWCDRLNEKHNARVNEFCMSEFDHSVFTQQYARAYIDGKTRYYSAIVDYFDESTWIHNRI